MPITDDHMSRTFAMLDHAGQDPEAPASRPFGLRPRWQTSRPAMLAPATPKREQEQQQGCQAKDAPYRVQPSPTVQ